LARALMVGTLCIKYTDEEELDRIKARVESYVSKHVECPSDVEVELWL